MLLLFILLFMSQAFYSPRLFFPHFLPSTLLPHSSFLFYSFISYRHSVIESEEEGREIPIYIRGIVKIIHCNIIHAFIRDIRRVLDFTGTKNISNLKLIPPSSFLHGTKKLVSERDFDLRLPSESILSFVMMKHSREFV